MESADVTCKLWRRLMDIVFAVFASIVVGWWRCWSSSHEQLVALGEVGTGRAGAGPAAGGDAWHP
jgi:hypothetical protein